jgi:hypothetical protein
MSVIPVSFDSYFLGGLGQDCNNSQSEVQTNERLLTFAKTER